MRVEKKFKNQLKEMEIELTKKQEQMFGGYGQLLSYWNDFMNLTGITDKEEVYEKHFLDSLSLAKALNVREVQKVLDVGAGAGFPGIPLKIAFPHLQIVLLDSLRKRVDFLEEVVKELELESVSCVHARAEDLAREEEYRQRFDLVVSRAVADLAVLSEYALPFVEIGGSFVAYKSISASEEVKKSSEAIELLGGQIKEKAIFELPGTKISRMLLRIEKVSNTPLEYPRRAGKPLKKPL